MLARGPHPAHFHEQQVKSLPYPHGWVKMPINGFGLRTGAFFRESAFFTDLALSCSSASLCFALLCVSAAWIREAAVLLMQIEESTSNAARLRMAAGCYSPPHNS
jgi:hypothetical protein